MRRSASSRRVRARTRVRIERAAAVRGAAAARAGRTLLAVIPDAGANAPVRFIAVIGMPRGTGVEAHRRLLAFGRRQVVQQVNIVLDELVARSGESADGPQGDQRGGREWRARNGAGSKGRGGAAAAGDQHARAGGLTAD